MYIAKFGLHILKSNANFVRAHMLDSSLLLLVLECQL